jgi:hypothetical protein
VSFAGGIAADGSLTKSVRSEEQAEANTANATTMATCPTRRRNSFQPQLVRRTMHTSVVPGVEQFDAVRRNAEAFNSADCLSAG